MRIIGNVKLSSQETFDLLYDFDMVFTPHISEQVELESYSKKLSQNALFVLALNDEKTLKEGFISYYVNRDNHFVYIPFIGVKHKGLGHIMMEALFSCLRNEYNKVLLEVRKTNHQAYDFYRRNGFLELEDRGFKWLMQRVL